MQSLWTADERGGNGFFPDEDRRGEIRKGDKKGIGAPLGGGSRLMPGSKEKRIFQREKNLLDLNYYLRAGGGKVRHFTKVKK